MGSVRALPICILLGLPLQATADVAPPRSLASEARAQTAEDKKLASCAPRLEQAPGPRGTLMTRRMIVYDLMVSDASFTPPESRRLLRAFVEQFYKAVRPCLPSAADLHAPERLPLTLHLLLTSDKVSSAVALATDKRVDVKCVEGIVLKQTPPPLPVSTSRLSVNITLAPFCEVEHELERGDGLPEPIRTGFGSRRNRHLMPLPASPSPGPGPGPGPG